jgi:hypothetical protein
VSSRTGDVVTNEWAAVLDELEEMARGRRAWAERAPLGASRGPAPAGAFQPPDGLPPMPAELVPRARAVLDGLLHAADAVGGRLDEVRGQIEQGAATHRAVGLDAAPPPTTLDVQA